MTHDVVEADFEQRVIERSKQVPVVVDFWAAWCGPCRQLTPALEKAASSREGQVDLAKVDVDQNGALAARFQVQGIPAVKAFRDGKVVDEFTGAIPPAKVESFFDTLVPSQADRLAEEGVRDGDEAKLRQALELDPSHLDAARALGRLLLRRGESDEALGLLEPFAHDFMAAGLGARARLSGSRDDLLPAFESWDSGDEAGALEALQAALAAEKDDDQRDLIRQVMVAIFTELGPEDPLAREHRRRLAAALH